MLTLYSYEINNFKNVKNFGPIAQEKFTILSGINSGGKSSLIQGLLLLKDLVLGKNDFQIDFTGLYVQLGDFEDVINNIDGADTIDLKLTIHFYKSSKYAELFFDLINSIQGTLKFFNGNNQYDHQLEKEDKIIITVDLAFGLIKKDPKKRGKVGIKKYFVEFEHNNTSCYLEIVYKNDRYHIKSNRLELIFNEDFTNYLFESGDFWSDTDINKYICSLTEKLNNNYKIAFDNQLFPVYAYKYLGINARIINKQSGLFINNLFNTKIKKVLEILTDEIKYLGPLREEPKLSYYVGGLNKDDIGIKGENAPKIFYFKNQYKFSFFEPPLVDDTLKTTIDYDYLKNHVNKWASYILGREVRYEVKKYSTENYGLFHVINDKRNRMTNVGVGASQIFPILVEGIRRKDGLFILEQPEIHLHPAAQARLADFLISICKCNYMKILVETHSEHIINRVVRRNIRLDINKDDVRILFVGQNGIEDIVRDEIGMISNWPDGFLDTGMNENEKLYIDQMKRLTFEG